MIYLQHSLEHQYWRLLMEVLQWMMKLVVRLRTFMIGTLKTALLPHRVYIFTREGAMLRVQQLVSTLLQEQ